MKRMERHELDAQSARIIAYTQQPSYEVRHKGEIVGQYLPDLKQVVMSF